MKSVRETIKEIVQNHLLKNKSLCFGQCLTAVGWVGGTLPELYEDEGMVEVTTADVANGGFVVGAALKGVRPIYVVRYQGFQWYNAPIIINYACKSKEIWGVPCPIFIRSIAMEGGIGPVAGSSHHSLFHRMPGVKILSPMTPKEYEMAYEEFMEKDDVYYISEHRGSFNNSEELPDIIYEDSDLILFPISITRFAAQQTSKILSERGLKISVIHQVKIKPFYIKEEWIKLLLNSKFGGIVLDDDYVDGISRCLAHEIMFKTKKNIDVMGLNPRTAGFHPKVDNLPPSVERIIDKVYSKIESDS